MMSYKLINWNEEWKNAIEKTSARNRREDQIQFWDEKAPVYARMEEQEGIERAEKAIQCFGIDSQTTILDVGCGPGTLAVPLAKVAASITALDQSQGMIAEVKKRAEREQVNNIRYINLKWEDAVPGKDFGPHDIVIASYSLDVINIEAALRKLYENARQLICLYWFAGNGNGIYKTLWPQVFGETYYPFPNHILLLNVLHHMGIYPNVEISTLKTTYGYTDLKEAVDYWKHNLQVRSSVQVEKIRRHLRKILPFENGRYLYHWTLRNATIWWRKDHFP